MINKLDDMLKKLKGDKRVTLSVAAAHDEEVLLAIKSAVEMEIITPILIGEENKIREISKEINFDLSKFKIINKGTIEECAETAVKLVSSGEADFAMKGLLDTSVILKAVLNKEWGLRTDSLLSHVMVYEVPSYDKLLVTTDGGMNIEPDYDQKVKILKNAIKATEPLGLKAIKVAALAAKEKVNPKMKATIEKNQAMRTIAKLMLNSTYGKFASATKTSSKIPYLKENGIVGYLTVEDKEREPVYTALASFVTAHARDLTIRSAVATHDTFVYADTDSLHIIDNGELPDIPIDDVKLGYFKLESKPNRGRFLRAKTYIEEIYDEKTDNFKLDVKCAGMNPEIKELITWDNFRYGFTSDLKRKPKNVKGGVIIENIPFTISTPRVYNRRS